MPHRIQAMHEGLAMIIGAASGLVASIAGLLAEVDVQAFNGPAILDNERFRLVCLIGAMGGAILNLGIYPAKTPGIRPMAWQFTTSVLCGVVFTPMIVHWTGVTANFDTLAFISFMMAITGVGLVVKLMPALQRLLFSKLGLSNGDADVPCPPAPAPAPAPTTVPAPSDPPNTASIAPSPPTNKTNP